MTISSRFYYDDSGILKIFIYLFNKYLLQIIKEQRASLVAHLIKNSAMQETWVQSLGWEDPLEKGKALQYSGLENSMDCIVYGLAKSQTKLSRLSLHCQRAKGFPGGASGKESSRQCRRHGFNRWVGKMLWRRAWQPTPVFLPGEAQGQRSLVDHSPWGHIEWATTEAT